MGGMHKPPWENKPSFRLVDSGQILFDRLRHMEVGAALFKDIYGQLCLMAV
jgi:hypothetical protein